MPILNNAILYLKTIQYGHTECLYRTYGIGGWVYIYNTPYPIPLIPNGYTNRKLKMISNEKIELLRTTAHDNLLDVISDFVKLKKKGSQYNGSSPFANERSPSFYVHPSKGIFKCFSTGKGGDCLRFLQFVNDWTFIQAAQYLGKRFGIDIDGVDEFSYTPKERIIQPVLPTSYIDTEVAIKTIGEYTDNELFKYLSNKFTEVAVQSVFELYKVGCIKLWLIYWQFDYLNQCRSGKFIKYLSNGHRDKESRTGWEHTKIRSDKNVYPDFNLVQCFFGEHLITSDIRKPIAIVESEKTAIIASLFMPAYIWLACGSKNGINDLKCQILANRSVTLFPDLGCYNEWGLIAKQRGFSINNMIEKKATEEDKLKGFDLADFLLR